MREKFIAESSRKRVILPYCIFSIHFNAKGGWVSTLPVSLHHRSMECKLPFIRKYSVNLEFHLTALLRRAGNTRLQSN